MCPLIHCVRLHGDKRAGETPRRPQPRRPLGQKGLVATEPREPLQSQQPSLSSALPVPRGEGLVVSQSGHFRGEGVVWRGRSTLTLEWEPKWATCVSAGPVDLLTPLVSLHGGPRPRWTSRESGAGCWFSGSGQGFGPAHARSSTPGRSRLLNRFAFLDRKPGLAGIGDGGVTTAGGQQLAAGPR